MPDRFLANVQSLQAVWQPLDEDTRTLQHVVIKRRLLHRLKLTRQFVSFRGAGRLLTVQIPILECSYQINPKICFEK